MSAASSIEVVAASALATPLVYSSVATGWHWFWTRQFSGVLSYRTHAALVVTLSVAAIVIMTVPGRFAFLLAGLTYAVLAAGVVVLRRSRGAVPCGCWGPSARPLSYKLAAFDGLLGVAALGVASVLGTRTAPEPSMSMALLFLGTLTALLATAVVPTGIQVTKQVKESNVKNQSLRRLRGFPDLAVPSGH